MSNINTEQIISSAIPIRPCPHCAAMADLRRFGDPALFGVRCRSCRAGFDPIHFSEASALIAWNQRRGTASAFGGRATKGLTSAKKRRSSRANLALARRSKQMIAIRAKTDEAIALLRPYREAEQRELDAQREHSSARLAALVPRLEADPRLRGRMEFLKSRPAHAEPGPVFKRA